MRTLLTFLVHLFAVVVKLLRPGGARDLAAENLALKQQLIVMGRSRKRAPNLTVADRAIFGVCSLFIAPKRLTKVAVVIRPSTLLRLHRLLVQKKYCKLFAPAVRGKSGPKGPTQDVIDLVVELKQRNPRFGTPRIAYIVANTLGIEINKDVVRRILDQHYRPPFNGTDGPSWLTFFGDVKDSLWSIDLFRCESILLNSHWVLAVMDIHTRRIVGFAVHRGPIDAESLCSMFARAISGNSPPAYISTDNDPLFESCRWQASLRVLDVDELKSVPYTPQSHPFIERLIGTVRREYLDQTLFWTATDLERKLDGFASFYNNHRVHSSLNGDVPAKSTRLSRARSKRASNFGWQSHLNGLCQLPTAA